MNWFAVFGPSGLPSELIALWNKALRTAVLKPDMQKRYLENGMDAVLGSPEDLKAMIVADRKKWSERHPVCRHPRRLDMALVATAHGALHYEVVEQTTPWQMRGLADPVPSRHRLERDAVARLVSGADRSLSAGDLRHARLRPLAHPRCRPSDWSLDLMVEDLFAVADAAGLKRFHLVGESIGGTVALAATIARPDRIATLTVSNGAHLGATIGRVHAWKKQLDEGGPAGWSKAFMPDRFHADAFEPRALGLVRGAAGRVAAQFDPQGARAC